jgi:hypothetical protein
MDTGKNNKRPTRKPIDRRARMIEAMLHKLEANPHRRYEDVLSAEEYGEALAMIRAAVAHVQGCMAEQRYNGRRVRPPARFEWRGNKYPLQYSNLGACSSQPPAGRA